MVVDDLRFLEPGLFEPDRVRLVLLYSFVKAPARPHRLVMFEVDLNALAGGSGAPAVIGSAERGLDIPGFNLPTGDRLRLTIAPLWIPDAFIIAEPGRIRLIHATAVRAASGDQPGTSAVIQVSGAGGRNHWLDGDPSS